jgi:hypothetical protein
VGRATRIIHAAAIAATLVVDVEIFVYFLLTISELDSPEAFVTGLVFPPVLVVLGGLSVLRPRGKGAVAFIGTAALFGLVLAWATPSQAYVWAPYLVASATGLLQYRLAVPVTPPAAKMPTDPAA